MLKKSNVRTERLVFNVSSNYELLISSSRDDDSECSGEWEYVEYDDLPVSEQEKLNEYINNTCEFFEYYIKNDHSNRIPCETFRDMMKEQWNCKMKNNTLTFEIDVPVDMKDEIEKGFDMECTSGFFCNDGMDEDEGPLGVYRITLF